jgi:hypothetical protein
VSLATYDHEANRHVATDTITPFPRLNAGSDRQVRQDPRGAAQRATAPAVRRRAPRADPATTTQPATHRPGDVIATGTPAVGAGFAPPRFLAEGDTIYIEMSGIGALTNMVIAG